MPFQRLIQVFPCIEYLSISLYIISGFVTTGPSTAAISCLVARQLCSEQKTCSQILEVIPKTCGLELGKVQINYFIFLTKLEKKNSQNGNVHFENFIWIFFSYLFHQYRNKMPSSSTNTQRLWLLFPYMPLQRASCWTKMQSITKLHFWSSLWCCKLIR